MYPGNKRANEDVSIGPNDNKRNRNAPGPTSRPEFRFLVAASDANAIFGRSSCYKSFSTIMITFCFVENCFSMFV